MRRARPAILIAALAALALISGCGVGARSGDGRLRVLAAESTWGSLARYLAGNRLAVSSIVDDPGTDPHSYEPRPSDARAVAGAAMVIVNGVGYDPWASRLLEAAASRRQRVLDVGAVLGLAAPTNPHRWYAPADVDRVVDAITAAYRVLDPGHAAYFDRRHELLRAGPLADFHRAVQRLRSRASGAPVGASESIFEPLAQALGLRLRTPSGFLRAIAEGTEPSAADKQAVDRQIAAHQIRAWVYNRQNSTPDVTRLTEAARRAGIPVVAVTETLSPRHASFTAWQMAQLGELAQALTRRRS
ncbi:MAG TPA: zinc ABC transporter substrate-binding protein [Solirubrobacteraceae bacterium]|nr:zinc ABC transporter substrate-binding protein [Solirubrobacteraceae bacterium]